MAEQLMEGVKPTRMALLEIRKKLELAEKGHKLLEEKRDALVEKFFKVIDKRKEFREKVNSEIKEAFNSLIQAQMILGEDKIEGRPCYKIEGLASEGKEVSYYKRVV